MPKEDKEGKKYNYAITVGAVTFIGSVLAILFILKPLYVNFTILKNEASAKNKKYEDLVTRKDNLDSMKSREKELKEKAVVVSSVLPEEKEVGRLFIQLDKVAVNSSGNLQSVSELNSNTGFTGNSVIAETPIVGVTKYSYSLPVSFENYVSFKKFVIDAGSALRLFNIKTFTVIADNAGKVNASVIADTYVRDLK